MADITKKPSSPSNVTAIKKDGNTFSSTWRNPSSGSSSSSSSRWQYLCRQWQYHNPEAKEKDEKWINVYNSTIGLNSTSSSWTLNRDDKYYPAKGKPKIDKVKFRIWSNNEQGDSNPIEKVYPIYKPKPPKVEFDYDEENAVLSITIDASNSKDNHERYDTQYTVWRKNNGISDSYYVNGEWVKAKGPNGNALSGSFKGNKTTLTHSVNQSSLQSQDAFIAICVTTTTRGLAGDTKTDLDDAPRFWIRPPEQVKITKITCANDNTAIKSWSDVRSRGQVTVYYKEADGESTAKYDTKAPVSYELQRIVTDASIKRPIQVRSMNFTTGIDTNMGATASAVDNSAKGSNSKNPADACMGEPAVDVLEAMIDHHNVDGMPYDCRVWYRVKSSRQGMVTYSEPVEAKEFYVAEPTAAGSDAAILSMETGNDGTSIDMVIGWNDPEEDASSQQGTGDGDASAAEKRAVWTTEVSWSTYENAWRSNKKPEVFDVDWKDNSATHNSRTNASKWDNTAAVSITGLNVGEKYYVQVRRHMVLDDAESYGDYTHAPSGYWPFQVTDDPSSVIVSVNGPIVLGRDLRVSWSHDAQTPQKSWSIYVVENRTNYTGKASKLKRKVLLSGTDASDFAVIPSEVIKRCSSEALTLKSDSGTTTKTIDTTEQMAIGVGISTGGSEVVSYSDTEGKYTRLSIVDIVQKPNCQIYIAPTVTAQPVTFYVFCKTPQATAICHILADGITIPFPDRDLVQAEDDYVWTGTVEGNEFIPVSEMPSADKAIPGVAEWANNSRFKYYAKVELSGLSLYDGGSYRLVAYTVSTATTLLRSENTRVLPFTVSYSHQAQPAGTSSRCTAYLEDTPYVSIYVARPSNYVSTDRFNLYRMTPDGGYLVAADIDFNTTIIDSYPPFSKVAELYYVIATCTADGDYEFLEVPYELKRHGLRFDWGDGEFVELPYNIELADTFQKDVEIRSHTSGLRSAYINEAVTRTGSIQTQLIKLQSPEQFEKVRKLAMYPGTALCRAHDGTCYEAIVNVSNLGNSYDSLLSPVSITTEEVRLSDRFKANNRGFERYTQ